MQRRTNVGLELLRCRQPRVAPEVVVMETVTVCVGAGSPSLAANTKYTSSPRRGMGVQWLLLRQGLQLRRRLIAGGKMIAAVKCKIAENSVSSCNKLA